jgi:hypothetical protein
MTNWQQRAKQAMEQGYQPGNWQAMLHEHLTRYFPELVQELGKDLEAYLKATTFEAVRMCERLEEQGTPNQTAEELALSQLFQTPPDELERTQPYDLEEGASDQEAATLRALLKSPSTSPLPRKLPLTSPPETSATEK